jgi:hypothetical protein
MSKLEGCHELYDLNVDFMHNTASEYQINRGLALLVREIFYLRIKCEELEAKIQNRSDHGITL